MSSTKWLAQCVSPEVSYTRRSSLNQIDILSQLTRPSSFLTPRSTQVASSHGSYLNLPQLQKVFSSNSGRRRHSLVSEAHSISHSLQDNQNRNEQYDKNSGLIENLKRDTWHVIQNSPSDRVDDDPRCGQQHHHHVLLSTRRASCDCLMPSLLHYSGSSQRHMLRRSSLASTGIKRSPSLLTTAVAPPRALLCVSPPLQATGAGLELGFSSRVPSLSPCVEVELREKKFLFNKDSNNNISNYENNNSNISWDSRGSNSSCSPFLHNENFSKLFEGNGSLRRNSNDVLVQTVHEDADASDCRVKQGRYLARDRQARTRSECEIELEDGNPSSVFPPCKRKCSVPSLRVEEPSPETETEVADIHDGISLWLVSHIRDHSDKAPSASKVTGSSNSSAAHPVTAAESACSIRRLSSCRLNVPLKRNAFSSCCSRRASLDQDGPGTCSTDTSRKTSLHDARQQLSVGSVSSTTPPGSLSTKRPRVGAMIGRGGFGTVHVGRFRGSLVAVKQIHPRKARYCLVSEVVGLTLPRHPYLVTSLALVTSGTGNGGVRVQYRDEEEGYIHEKEIPLKSVKHELGVALSPSVVGHKDVTSMWSSRDECNWYEGRDKNEGRASDDSWLWVVSELCSTVTLLTVLHSQLQLTIKQKLKYLVELSSGLLFLHSQGVVHRDVKPANAFLTTAGTLRLGDYGCSGVIDGEMRPVIGTIPYQAPEVLKGSMGCPRADVYSLGVTMWHVLYRTAPYQGLHPHVIAYNVTRRGLRPDSTWGGRGETSEGPALHQSLLEAMVSALAQQCWRPCPDQRPSTADLARTLALLHLAPQ